MALEGMMNVGHSEMDGAVRKLPLEEQIFYYKGLIKFVNGVMEHLKHHSSVLIDYTKYLEGTIAGLERQRQEAAERAKLAEAYHRY